MELEATPAGRLNWIYVHDFSANSLEFEAHFEGMAAFLQGVVDLGIPARGVLELRVCGLTAEYRKAGNVLRIQAAGEVSGGRESVDTVKILFAGAP